MNEQTNKSTFRNALIVEYNDIFEWFNVKVSSGFVFEGSGWCGFGLIISAGYIINFMT